MSIFKDYRIKKKLKQIDLAKKLGVKQSTVSSWESGLTKPRADKLIKLSKIFNCTIDELLK